MNFLFVHQNFPAQFKNLAPTLVERGHKVVALTTRSFPSTVISGVQLETYHINVSSAPDIHPWARDFEAKIIRGEACYHAALKLRDRGFYPDRIIVHPGWGEGLYLKDVWPKARLAIYCEFFYNRDGFDVGFDPEHNNIDEHETSRLRSRNFNNFMHMEVADAGLSPTEWQKSTFPESFQDKISVIHEGIDTQKICPNDKISMQINESIQLRKGQKLVTFVNRNLEPYRGYHTFMRAVPEILRLQPDTRVLVVGGNEVSYGSAPPLGTSWKDIYLDEISNRLTDGELKRIHFLGKVPYETFIGLLQISAVHVYLTYPFVLSWSLLEAMSAGCAIVASKTAPVQEVISGGAREGILVDFFDSQALANEVCDLLDNPLKREEISKYARSKILNGYDLQTICLPKLIAWAENF